MPKRFTATEIWKDQRWFRKLKPIYKLAFFYIKDQCTHAGIWKIDCSDLIEDLGLDEFNINDFIDCVNLEYDKITGEKSFKERIVIVNNNLWITGFIQFQYENKEGRVNISAPVKTALMNLSGLSILSKSINKGYITLTQDLQQKYITLNDNCLTLIEDLHKGLFTPKDKDKDKDKKGGEGGKIFAVGFDGEFAIFKDGSKQKLNVTELFRLKNDDLKAGEILKVK